VGTALGSNDGTGVVAPGTYVGDRVGEEVGFKDGVLEGSGVGLP